MACMGAQFALSSNMSLPNSTMQAFLLEILDSILWQVKILPAPLLKQIACSIYFGKVCFFWRINSVNTRDLVIKN